jgi:hypothetical protein
MRLFRTALTVSVSLKDDDFSALWPLATYRRRRSQIDVALSGNDSPKRRQLVALQTDALVYSSSGSAKVLSIIVSCVATGANVCDVPK